MAIPCSMEHPPSLAEAFSVSSMHTSIAISMPIIHRRADCCHHKLCVPSGGGPWGAQGRSEYPMRRSLCAKLGVNMVSVQARQVHTCKALVK